MTREEAIKVVKRTKGALVYTEKEKEALATLIPELRESKDERIRKALIEALKTSKTVGELKFVLPEPTREECIAYLEKQKELDKMIVVSPEVWDNAISDAYENGKKDNEKQKENPEEPKIAFGNWGDKEKQEAIFTCLKYMRFIKKITNQEYNDLTEWLGSNLVYNLLGNGWYLKQKEQKGLNVTDFCQPINPDIAKVLPDVINELTWGDEKQKKQKPYEPKNWPADKDNLTQEQKPAEWSEKFIADVFEKVGLAKIVREQGNDRLTNAVQSAMLELSKVENTEWSEEDEEIFNNIIEKAKGGYWIEVNEITWLINRFKTLRPSWKPSEDEERLINTIISFLKDFADKGYENAVECIDWLKSKLNGNTCK